MTRPERFKGLVENGQIQREITKDEGAFAGLDPELVQFLNALAQEQIKVSEIKKNIKNRVQDNK